MSRRAHRQELGEPLDDAQQYRGGEIVQRIPPRAEARASRASRSFSRTVSRFFAQARRWPGSMKRIATLPSNSPTPPFAAASAAYPYDSAARRRSAPGVLGSRPRAVRRKRAAARRLSTSTRRIAWSAKAALPACFASLHLASSRKAEDQDESARSLASPAASAASMPSRSALGRSGGAVLSRKTKPPRA